MDQPSPPRPAPFDIYRLAKAPDLYCAVSVADPTPAFLSAGRWQYARRVARSEDAPPGFQHDNARGGIKLNGFYLFLGR